MATDGKPAGTFRAAAVQDGSVWLDRVASTAKACELIVEAGRGGADIVALPESFIPGFPYWLFTRPLMEGAAFHRRLHDEAVEIPGPTITALGEAAAEAGVTAVVGRHRARPGPDRDALQHQRRARARRVAAGQAPQARADLGRARGLGRRRRLHAVRVRHRVRARSGR